MVFFSEELAQDLAKRLDQMINAVPEMPVLPYPNPQYAKRKEIISRIMTNRHRLLVPSRNIHEHESKSTSQAHLTTSSQCFRIGQS